MGNERVQVSDTRAEERRASLGRAPSPIPVELLPRAATVATARVVLVQPPAVVFPQSLSTTGPVPPLGLAYLAAALRHAGHHVRLIDAVGEGAGSAEDFRSAVGTLRRIGLSPAEIVDRIDPDVQLIGLGHMFLHEWPLVRETAERARARFPDVPIICGGENATAYWRWMFEQTDALDAVVLGEGELTAIRIADRVAEGRSFHDLPSVVPAVGRAEGRSSDPPGSDRAPGLPDRIRRLDAIPAPAWDLVPLDRYWRDGNFLGVQKGRSMPMLATRGCPYRCSFCSSPQMWTTRYSVREPAEVVDEISGYVERYGVDDIDFCDLTAITKRQWTLDLCDELERRDLGITWQLPIGTRSEALDAEVLRRLWETGCRNITYSPESGSPRMLARWDKRLDLDHLLASMRAASATGLTVHMNTIIGHPDETVRDLLLTWRLFIRCALAGCDTGSPIMFCPYPGSADFTALVEAGRVDVDDHYVYIALSRGSSAHRSFNPRLSGRTLRLVQLAMLATFYAIGVARRPRRLVSYARAVFRQGHETDQFEMMLRVKLRSVLGLKGRRGATSK